MLSMSRSTLVPSRFFCAAFCTTSGVQRLDEQHKHRWASAGLIEEIAFLHKAEVFVKTLNVGTTMAPNFDRQDVCAGMVNERLKDFPPPPVPRMVSRTAMPRTGIVNSMTIGDLHLVNSVGKWGAGPNLREETSPERSEREGQWGKLIKQKNGS